MTRSASYASTAFTICRFGVNSVAQVVSSTLINLGVEFDSKSLPATIECRGRIDEKAKSEIKATIDVNKHVRIVASSHDWFWIEFDL